MEVEPPVEKASSNRPCSSGSKRDLMSSMMEILTTWSMVEEEAVEFMIEQLSILAEAQVPLES